jgi:hypothetical protein
MLTVLWGSAAGITGAGSVEIADPAGSSHDLWGRRLAAGDFDGDGKQDLVGGTDHSKVYVLKGGIAKDGGYGSRQTLQAPILTDQAPADLTAGNVNSDAATDLVVSGYEADSGQGWNANFPLLGGGSGLNASAHQEPPCPSAASATRRTPPWCSPGGCAPACRTPPRHSGTTGVARSPRLPWPNCTP